MQLSVCLFLGKREGEAERRLMKQEPEQGKWWQIYFGLLFGLGHCFFCCCCCCCCYCCCCSGSCSWFCFIGCFRLSPGEGRQRAFVPKWPLGNSARGAFALTASDRTKGQLDRWDRRRRLGMYRVKRIAPQYLHEQYHISRNGQKNGYLSPLLLNLGIIPLKTWLCFAMLFSVFFLD